jgi:hypothetical protein
VNFRNIGPWGKRLSNLFAHFDTELAWQNAVRQIAAAHDPGDGRRISPESTAGDELVPVNDQRRTAHSAYRIRFASYVSKGQQTCSGIDKIPEQLRLRALAVHAFDANAMTVGFEVVEGRDLEAAIERQLANPGTTYLRIHSALRGCFAAQVERN